MYLRKAITLQADSCHNLDPFQMICISFEILMQCSYIDVSYHSVVKVKKNRGVEFFEINLQSSICSYIYFYKVVIFVCKK